MSDDESVRTEAFHAHMNVFVVFYIKHDCQEHRKELADDGGDCGAGDAQFRSAEKSEDQNGIENDVRDRSGSLGQHREEGPSGSLKDPFHRDFHKDSKAQHCTEAHIGDAVGIDFRIAGLKGEKRFRQKKSEHSDNDRTEQCQKNTIVCRVVCAVKFFFSEALRQQSVDSDGGAGSYGDHQVLDREHKGYGGQGVLIDLCDKGAVDNVVQGLDQHGDDDRQ